MSADSAMGAVAPEVARRAVEWLVELQSGEATDATRQAHRTWLRQHPDHERAWSHIEAVNQRLRSAAGASAVAQATLAPPRSPGRRRAVKMLVLLLFAGAGARQAEQRMPWREWLADERTGVGERRTIALADGSTVALNSDTAIDIRLTAAERRLRLAAGEVLIVTGKDTGRGGGPRPFVVETGHGELRPLGTRFAVRRRTGASRVDVFEGAVAVLPHDLADGGIEAGQGRVLRAGERAEFTRSAVSLPQPASEADTAWTDGMLVANGMRLDDFLAELDRHRPGHLACDPAVAHLRVSGTYPLADTNRILDLLRTTLPVETHFFTRYWVTLRPAHR